MIIRILFLPFFILLVLVSCQDDGVSMDDQTTEATTYMPLSIGHELIYQVNEIIFRNEGQDKDTLNYQLRELVIDSLTNELNETSFFVDRFTRNDVMSSWNYRNTWQVHIAHDQVIRTEDNLPYIKLDLPPLTGKQWDATSFFDESNGLIIGGQSIDYFKGWESTYTQVKGISTVSNVNYDDVLEIQISNLENLLEIRKAKEVYAADIGLIFREFLIADTQCFSSCSDIPWAEKGEKGHLYTQQIIN